MSSLIFSEKKKKKKKMLYAAVVVSTLRVKRSNISVKAGGLADEILLCLLYQT